MNVGYRDFARVVVECIKMQGVLAEYNECARNNGRRQPPILRSQLAVIKLYADNIKNFNGEIALSHCRDEIYQTEALPNILAKNKIETYLRQAFRGAINIDPQKIDEQIERVNNPWRRYVVPQSKTETPPTPDFHQQPALAALAM